MLVIGLTGGIATGKSTVSKLLRARKIPVVDADVLARQVVEPGTSGLKKIVSYFGPDVLLPDGTLDRKKLGSIVFNNEEKRKKLNSIVHPAVRWAMFRKVVEYWVGSEKYCVLDVPLLIEGGVWKWVGKVVVVYCSADIQLQRLMMRDNSTVEEATSRLNSQLPIAEKVEYADIVIDNSGTPQELDAQIDAFVEKLDKEVGWIWWIGYILPFMSLFSAIWVLTSRWLRRSSQQRKKQKDIKRN
ncbi:Dephospho-CoA kinase [Hypsizygus marmoreus]|uniref:Dephospho-CoA kinase n=1 Tax=Hypsizygus marmoreus TaxID=39966 RepID=A0A369JR19_HYPMA|nr:Dephospho-CoA kinase [Hypsizygus marmoreus]